MLCKLDTGCQSFTWIMAKSGVPKREGRLALADLKTFFQRSFSRDKMDWRKINKGEREANREVVNIFFSPTWFLNIKNYSSIVGYKAIEDPVARSMIHRVFRTNGCTSQSEIVKIKVLTAAVFPKPLHKRRKRNKIKGVTNSGRKRSQRPGLRRQLRVNSCYLPRRV